jgi:DNA invertase Pin-like site-specific DNA recombinase
MEHSQTAAGNLALTPTPRVITIAATQAPETKKLRVAAYARVSSKSEEQLNSFAAQNAYYTELITKNPDWEFVDVYADEGVTGTSTAKRDDFNRMMADCKRGRIDKILVKSTSRFARNIKDCLEATRQLKEIGVGVCFEEQNIDSSMLSGEMLVAFFSALSQKESQSISADMRWSVRRRMRAGKFNTCRAPYGFRLGKGTLEITPEEAEIVRDIYERYLRGQSSRDIARELTRAHDKRWNRQSIEYILKNERYCGNAVMPKRYATDTFPVQMKRNRGEREMYYVSGINEPIITVEQFESVQRLMKRKESARERREHSFSGMIKCGRCGTTFRQKQVNHIWYWSCRTHEEVSGSCEITQIPESVIENAFLRLYDELKYHLDILTQMQKDLQAAHKGRLLWSLDIVELNSKISDITRQDRLLTELKKQGIVDPDIFISRRNALAEQLRTAKIEKERILNADEDTTIAQTQALIDILNEGPDFLDTFDGELFSELVDKIIVESNEQLRFRLINGLELTGSIERTVR